MDVCVICEKKTRNHAYLCRGCYQEHGRDAPWIEALITQERERRNQEDYNKRNDISTLEFSELEGAYEGNAFDGWDFIDGVWDDRLSVTRHEDDYYVTSDDFEDILYRQALEEEVDEEWERIVYCTLAMHWCWLADLTESETMAMQVYIYRDQPSAKEAAEYLTAVEDKPVSPEAYRRRLSDALRKLKATGKTVKARYQSHYILSLRQILNALAFAKPVQPKRKRRKPIDLTS